MTMGTMPPSITRFGKWMALTAALLGWLFDGLEMGLFPLVARPALVDLLTTATAAGRPTSRSPRGSGSSPPCFSSGRQPAACCSAGSATASAECGR